MITKGSVKQDNRIAMLETGMGIMLEKGYTNTGIQEILSALNIPKGSFYHYFESKEAYALEVIRHYEQQRREELKTILSDKSQTPLVRLKRFCENSKARLSAQKCSKGCLIGNLSQEMADQSEVLRKELSNIILKWTDIIAVCIKEGQKAGEITREMPAETLAEFFHAAWLGSILRAKTLKNTKPLDVCINTIFNTVIKSE